MAEEHGRDVIEGAYSGPLFNRVARLLATAHGGQILLSEVTAALLRDRLLASISLRSLGLYHLKDLLRPEQIFQVVVPGLPADFPPLKTMVAVRTNLPPARTNFIGREREVGELQSTLATTRLLTLTGAGGSGKTSLALELARNLQDRYHHGVLLVELAAISEASLVVPALATALGIREKSGEPLLATIIASLHDMQLLLVLDNCEHLIDACAQLASAILHTCPRVQLLATSRETLRVVGEITYPVPPLVVPAPEQRLLPDEVMQYDAIRLFIDRARAVQPGFVLTAQNAGAVVQICRHVDGLPLAIELAVTRLRSLTPEQLAGRLGSRLSVLTGGARDTLPRQQTLRALIDWSYTLLARQERLLFQRLAVFAGGWTLEAAEAVCVGDGIAAAEIMDLLDQLVNKSLVVVDAKGRYQMLETIREYALEQLVVSGAEATLQTWHLAYLIRLGTEAEPGLRSDAMPVWLARLQAEKGNLNTALAWARERDPEAGLRLLLTLSSLWGSINVFTSICPLIEDLLTHCPADAYELRSQALFQALFYAYYGGDLPQAEIIAGQLLPLVQTLNKPGFLASYVNWMGMLAAAREDNDQAGIYFEEAERIAHTTGDSLMIAGLLVSQAIHLFNRGANVTAQHVLAEALQLYQASSSKHAAIAVLNILGRVCLARGDVQAARSYLSKSLRLRLESGFRITLSANYEGLAGLQLAEGHAERAATLLGIAEAQRIMYGNPCPPIERPFVERVTEGTRIALDLGSFASFYNQGKTFSHEQALAYALDGV